MKKHGFMIGAALLLAAALNACGGAGAAETTAAPAPVQETEAAPETEAAQETGQAEAESKESASDGKGAESSEAAAEAGEAAEADQAAEADTPAAEAVTLRLGVPKAPPALPVLHMIEENALGDQAKIELDIWDAPEQLLAMVQDGDHDMFAFPLTVVAKLYNKGVPVVLTNANTWGVTYFMTTDPDFSDWSQLKGKTVYIPLQSSPPDVLTQYFIDQAGLKIGEDVEVIYSTTQEVAQMLANGTAQYATLIEPQCTAAMAQNPDVRVAMSFESEWQKIKGADAIIPNAGFGTTKPFIEKNPELTAEFEAAYEEALNWVLENPEEAAKLAEKYLGLKPPIVQKAIPNMGLMYRNSFEAKPELDDYYQLLSDFDAKMIGGKVPDEGMYYKK